MGYGRPTARRWCSPRPIAGNPSGDVLHLTKDLCRPGRQRAPPGAPRGREWSAEAVLGDLTLDKHILTETLLENR